MHRQESVSELGRQRQRGEARRWLSLHKQMYLTLQPPHKNAGMPAACPPFWGGRGRRSPAAFWLTVLVESISPSLSERDPVSKDKVERLER